MFFDQLNERNTMVKSVLAFEKVGQVSLADLGSRLSRLDGSGLRKVVSFARAPNAMIQVSFLAILMVET
jgi:hypothetical protein